MQMLHAPRIWAVQDRARINFREMVKLLTYRKWEGCIEGSSHGNTLAGTHVIPSSQVGGRGAEQGTCRIKCSQWLSGVMTVSTVQVRNLTQVTEMLNGKKPGFKPRSVRIVFTTCVHVLSHIWLFATHGSSVHGIFQARIMKWVAISSSRGSSWPKDRTCISCLSCIDRRILSYWATWEAIFTVYTELLVP